MLLESFYRFDDVADIDPLTGRFVIYLKRDRPDLAEQPIRGAFAGVGPHRVVFYRMDDALHLRVDDADVELTDETVITFEQGEEEVIVVSRGERSLIRIEYQPPVDGVDQWRMYLNPFIEEEHLDFGRYIYETVNNTSRRNTAYRTT